MAVGEAFQYPRLIRYHAAIPTFLGTGMRRREFITLIGATTATWSVVARAQPSTVPVIGYLTGGVLNKSYIAAVLEGLKEADYVEGRNIALEYRSAEGRYERLPALAADLAGRNVVAILAEGGSVTARAAKQATSTIPIVFVNGDDPIKSGLVSSLNRPEANLTGVSLYGSALGPKKLELLREFVPQSGVIGVLANRGNASSEAEVDNVANAAKRVGQKVHILGAGTEDDIERAFQTFAEEHVAALLVATGVFFGDHRQRIVALAQRYSLPTAYDRREFAVAGGLMSYGTRFADVFRQGGAYLARILKGAKPADLPIEQPTKFELVINLKTARDLGLTVPPTLLALADEVIE
jgi:putative tryptophan/tyrosine transport system substrate-binding protein